MNQAISCIHTHTSGNFYALENTCKTCQSHNVCREIVLSLGSQNLKDIWNKHKAEIMRQKMVTNNWQSIGCNN
jgi:hypothetical protein